MSSYAREHDTLQQFFKLETAAYLVALCSNGSLRSTSKSALFTIIEGYGLRRSNVLCDVYVIDGPALSKMVKLKGNSNTLD